MSTLHSSATDASITCFPNTTCFMKGPAMESAPPKPMRMARFAQPALIYATSAQPPNVWSVLPITTSILSPVFFSALHSTSKMQHTAFLVPWCVHQIASTAHPIMYATSVMPVSISSTTYAIVHAQPTTSQTIMKPPASFSCLLKRLAIFLLPSLSHRSFRWSCFE